MKARRGVTLVEVMLAGSIAVLFTLSLMEGLIVAAKISNENSQLLAADAYAWDTAWKWFNKKYDDLATSNANGIIYQGTVSSNECPMICRQLVGSDAKVGVRVRTVTVIRHSIETVARQIEVDVAWGPTSERKSLNGMFNGAVESGTKSYSHPISIYKCSIDRGQL
ncbi:MAG: hypothetical protein K6G94_06435 [Kiritimatiellae bacterium]|nr:hypothetical protein [Kiritimatiellia bacterium]